MPLFGNALADAEALDSYAVAFLRPVRLAGEVPVRITLLDVEGKPLASNLDTPARDFSVRPWIGRVTEGGVAQTVLSELRQALLALAQPVVSFATGKAAGALVSELPLQSLLDQRLGPPQASEFVQLRFEGRALAALGAVPGDPMAYVIATQSVATVAGLQLVVGVDAAVAAAPLIRPSMITAAVGTGTSLVVLIVSVFVSRWLTRPIVELARQTRRIHCNLPAVHPKRQPRHVAPAQ